MTGQGKIFYGWWVVFATFLVILVSNGLTLAGLQTFDPALIGELDIERGVLKDRDAIILIVSAIFAPIAGALADRFGVRPLLIGGLVTLAVSLFAFSRVGSIGDIRLVSMITGVGLAGAGLVICVNTVSRWFVQRRGLAIGLMLAGTSLGNATMPQLTSHLIETGGWRTAFATIAILPLVMIPVVVLLIREWPRDRGVEAYGSEAGAAVAATSSGTMQDLWNAMRTANFWLIAAIAFMTFYSILGMNANIFLHLRDIGLGDQAAARAFIVIFVPGLVGKVVAGWLADRFGRKQALLGLIATMLVGAGLLASLNVGVVWIALFLFGLGWGGLYTMLQLLTAEVFGTRSLGKILGAIVFIDALGGATGQKVTAVLYDQTGSYSLSFTVIAALIAIALVLSLLVRIPSKPAL